MSGKDWKLAEKIPYPLFIGTQEAVFIVDAKEHPVALVGTDNANLFKVAPKMLELLENVTNIEQTTGSPCPLCGGSFNHKEHCIAPLAEKIVAEVEGK